MATRTENANANLVNNISTDARIRAFVNFIDATLTAGGWVNTTDTGQTAVASFTGISASANTKGGYRIYRMDDALQATAPVFMRIDFGAGPSNAPGLWLTIGTGSDGSGTITGVLFDGGSLSAATVGSYTASTSASHNYGSASTNRCAFLMYVLSTTGAQFIWALERTKDSSGADTDDGLLLSWTTGGGGVGALGRTQYIRYDGSVNPSVELGCTVTLSNNNPSAYNSNVGIGLVLHFAGTVQQPGISLVAVNSSDFVAEAQFTMSLYGVVRTYQLGDGNATSLLFVPTGNSGASLRATTRVGIIFE